MLQRNISANEIDEVLKDPETTYPSADHPDRTVYLGTCALSSRRLKLVVLTADPETVITVADRDVER